MIRRRKRALASLADEELMQLVLRKDVRAFELFYERHAGPAFSLAYRILGDRGAAEDATQEAFLSIWRSEAGYDRARGSVRTWALGIVRNRAIDAIRRQSAKRVPPLDLRGDLAVEREATGAETEGEALRRETARELRGVLGELPLDQAQVIELAYFGGFTQGEIAEMLGLPLGTVKGRIRLGLEKIRSALAEGIP